MECLVGCANNLFNDFVFDVSYRIDTVPHYGTFGCSVGHTGNGHCCYPYKQYQTTTMQTADTFTKVYMYFKYISSQIQQLP